VVVQDQVPILAGETVAEAEEQIHRAEHRLIVTAVDLVPARRDIASAPSLAFQSRRFRTPQPEVRRQTMPGIHR
jgi:folate-dependent phosphoribosylglycinamide formyltransferase PurN